MRLVQLAACPRHFYKRLRIAMPTPEPQIDGAGLVTNGDCTIRTSSSHMQGLRLSLGSKLRNPNTHVLPNRLCMRSRHYMEFASGIVHANTEAAISSELVFQGSSLESRRRIVTRHWLNKCDKAAALEPIMFKH